MKARHARRLPSGILPSGTTRLARKLICASLRRRAPGAATAAAQHLRRPVKYARIWPAVSLEPRRQPHRMRHPDNAEIRLLSWESRQRKCVARVPARNWASTRGPASGAPAPGRLYRAPAKRRQSNSTASPVSSFTWSAAVVVILPARKWQNPGRKN